MLQTKFMDDYIDYNSDVGAFMSTLLFPLTFAFCDTSEIVDFKACLYASIYLNQYYTAYYKKLEAYGLKLASLQGGEKQKCILHFCHSVSLRTFNVW